MLHKFAVNIIASIVSLIVIFILSSSFAASAALAYASASDNQITVKVYRSTGSTVGSVWFTDSATGFQQCIHLGQEQQGNLTYVGTFNDQDTITITNYPNASCQLWDSNQTPTPSFNDLARNLKSCGTGCMEYDTPVFSAKTPMTVGIVRGHNSGVGAVTVRDETQGVSATCVTTANHDQLIILPNITFDSQDTITINTFMDAQCTAGSGQVFSGLVSNLPESCGANCKQYTTN